MPAEARGSATGKDNVVAANAVVTGDLRALSKEQFDRAKKSMQEVASASLPHTRGTLTFDDGYPPMAPTDGNARLLDLYSRGSQALRFGPVVAVSPDRAGAADVSFVAGHAAMALDGVGLMGRDGHTPQETADLTTLPTQTKRAACAAAASSRAARRTAPKIAYNILDAIGHTPMVRINRITRGLPGVTVVAKLETFNPGNSIKDRMAVKMIEDAEQKGLLKPGGTIIEGTSGNTGMGLAIAAVVKGYKCVFTTTDKQSKEKIDALKAFGAEVIICPTNVDPEDPRSYYSVSSRLAEEIPNSWKANQYDNLSNTAAHYEQTGPEIWEQTDGRVTHLVVGVGTGGTVTGVGRYLKERNPKIKVWGIDTYGSVFKKYKETGIFDKHEIYPYITEGIGEDFLPRNVDFGVIDHFEKVTDKDAALMTRRLAREEGIFAGNSAGSAMAGLLQLKDHFHEGRPRRRDLPRPRLALSRQDVQRRLDAREGLHREDRHDGARSGRRRPVGRAVLARVQRAGRAGDSRDVRARLLADLGDARQAARRIAERSAPLPGAGARSRHQEPPRRVDHGAGVPVRRRLDAGRSAGDDDHAAQSGGARPRFQDRQDVHHHATDLIRVL